METSETRLVAELAPHPENVRIYGDTEATPAPDLVDSIRRHGVIQPVVITPDNLIISGHRRWGAARAAGLERVPVRVMSFRDELDLLEALVEHNRYRVKDGVVIGNEMRTLERIYHDRLSRQGERTNGTSAQICAEVPRPSRQAAAVMGVSHNTASHAARAMEAIELLDRQMGKAEEAKALKEKLRKSVSGAWKDVQAKGLIPPKPEAAPKPPPPALLDPDVPTLVTLPVWKRLTEAQRHTVMARPRDRSKRFNEQTNKDIEWAQWSWNPITGCEHGCAYCYARDITEGNADAFPQAFVPTILPERLGAARQTNVPEKAAQNIGFRNVFACSIADLFGRWVPTEWIEAVLTEVRGNPQWNFLFLTKFPIRYQEFTFPPNAWLGTTVDAQARVANAERAFERVEASVKWLSCEPLLEPLRFTRLDLFQWIVLGGASASTQTPEWRPPRAWIYDLERQADAAGCRVYEKDNLWVRRQEYPGVEPVKPVDVPEAFKMPYLQRDILEPEAYAAEMQP